MPVHVKVSGVWKEIKNIYTRVSGVWKTTYKGYVKASAAWKNIHYENVELTISSNTDNYNVYSSAGSPTRPIFARVTINSGITVGSTSTGTAAFDTGALPANSKVILVNNGSIHGHEGAGGSGPGWQNASTQYGCDNSFNYGTNGGAGGKAVNMQVDMDIDNTATGNIFGGGGGGGGGDGWQVGTSGHSSVYRHSRGGSGGAGQGADNTGGPSSGGLSVDPGGSGFSCIGANGGSGGAWGAAGSNGNTGGSCSGTYDEPCRLDFTCAGFSNKTDATSGGAGGASVDANGNTLTWIAGNNGTQVKGAQT